jgi:diguanylate cyclase (GGDEF)-like protein/PAS domain S-box-containing protein
MAKSIDPSTKIKYLTLTFLFVAFVIALISLSSWILAIETPNIFKPYLESMRFHTSICIILTSLALLAVTKEKALLHIKLLSAFFSLAVISIAVVRVIDYVFSLELSITSNPFLEATLVNNPESEKMAIGTCLIFIFLNLSILLIDNHKRRALQEGLILLSIGMMLLAIFSYIFSSDGAYAFETNFKFSHRTILCLAMLTLAILLVRPKNGITEILFANTPHRKSWRRVLAVTLFLPILLSILFKLGLELRFYEVDFGYSLLLTSCFTILFFLVWINAKQLQSEEIQSKEYQNKLVLTEQLFTEFSENIHDVFWRANATGNKMTYISPAFEQIWGRSRESMYENPDIWLLSVTPEDREKVEQFFIDLAKDRTTVSVEYRIIQPDGSYRYIYDRGFQLRNADNELIGLIGIATDVTDYKLATLSGNLKNSIAKIIETSNDFTEMAPLILRTVCITMDWDCGELWLSDVSGSNLECIHHWHAVFQPHSQLEDDQKLESTQPLNQSLAMHTWQAKKANWIPDIANTELDKLNCGDKKLTGFLGIPIIYHHICFGVMVFYSNKIMEPPSIILDSLDQAAIKVGEFIYHKNMKSTMESINQIDQLTGLLRRQAFEEVAQKILQQPTPQIAALYLIDIDQFELVYSSHGVDTADSLISALAKRLSNISRSHENVLLSHISGNRIAVFKYKISDSKHIAGYAELLQSTIKKPFVIHDREILTTASIGIATFPHDANDCKSLLKFASLALLLAREHGGDRYEFFSPTIPQVFTDRLSFENDLRTAIQKNEFFLKYQPQFDLRTGQLYGIEALIRWLHPVKGIIYPDAFIPVAEEMGLIVEIGEWALREACWQIQQGWLPTNLNGARLSVNISNEQFNDPDRLIKLAESLVSEFHIAPKTLELEITETVMMPNPEKTLEAIEKLRSLGFDLAIDDFGTGYSSLNYLNRIPAKKVKIDKSFIVDLPYNQNSAMIVRAVIALSHSLGMEVVAEGVEHANQFEFLIKEGCDAIQGYYFSTPRFLNDIKKFIQSKPTLTIPK